MIPRRGLMSGPSTLSTNQTCPQWQTRQEKRAAAERPVATLEPSQLSRRGLAAETLNARSDGPCLRRKADGVRQGIAGSWPVDGALRSDCAAGRSCGRARPSCRSEANPAMGKDPKTNLGVVARPVPNASAPLPVQRSRHVTRERRPQRVAVDTLGGRHGATGIALHLERRGDIAVAVEGTAVEQQTGAGSGRIPGRDAGLQIGFLLLVELVRRAGSSGCDSEASPASHVPFVGERSCRCRTAVRASVCPWLSCSIRSPKWRGRGVSWCRGPGRDARRAIR